MNGEVSQTPLLRAAREGIPVPVGCAAPVAVGGISIPYHDGAIGCGIKGIKGGCTADTLLSQGCGSRLGEHSTSSSRHRVNQLTELPRGLIQTPAN